MLPNNIHNLFDHLFNNLHVVHRLKDASGQGLDDLGLSRLAELGLVVDTCLRQVAIISDAEALAEFRADEKVNIYSNTSAYDFLLQTTTGLNSAVPGETNVQGQFRRAWDDWQEPADETTVHLIHSLMHQLFADARQVRREFLQGIGGRSYGSLVRKLLQPATDARLLFVGSGELAQSITPWFSDFDIALWNHHQPDSDHFGTMQVFAPTEINAAADWATHLIFTTPPDEAHDLRWADLADEQITAVAHLGRRRAQLGAWSDWPLRTEQHFFDLDDVFELRRSQDSVRSLNLSHARLACSRIAANLNKPRATAGPTVALGG